MIAKTPAGKPASGTPEWLRTMNDRAALRLIIANGSLSRSQLGKLSGMSKPTASLMVSRLEKLGLIQPTGLISGSRGPTAVTYGVRTDAVTGVAVSMEPNRIEAVVVDPSGELHPVVEIPVPQHRSPVTDIELAVQEACRAAEVSSKRCSHVMVAVQGAVNEATDELNFTDTLPGWPAKGACAEIKEATGWDVAMDNDANLAAVAEREEGTADGYEDFIYLWLGTGIGAGLDMDFKTRRGSNGSAGEVGYLEVPLSAQRFDPDARDFTDLLADDALIKMTGKPTFKESLEALGESPELLEEYAERLQLLVNPLVSLLDPGLLLLGGPTGAAVGEQLLPLLEELSHSNVTLRVGATGDRGALEGARTRLLMHLHKELERRILESA